MADPVYHDSHETLCTSIFEKDKLKHTFCDQIDENNLAKPHFVSTNGSCSGRYSIRWSSRLCVRGAPDHSCLCFDATHDVPLASYCA